MKCFNCGEESNPTMLYCVNCGVPLDTDIETLQADEDRRREQSERIVAARKAKELLVLALFCFASLVALRLVFLRKQHYDWPVSYRAPYSLVEEAGIDPPIGVDSERLPIPLPKSTE